MIGGYKLFFTVTDIYGQLDDGMHCISRLDDQVSVQLRSHVVITSVECVVRELLANAIEADCTRITIKVDLDTLSVCCEDDGRGISRDDLSNIDKRYRSSKNSDNGAHRGEALNSIMECSATTVIESKMEGEATGHFAFPKSAVPDNLVSMLSDFFDMNPISKSGTTVMVTRLFSRSPVRYRYLKESLKSNWLKRTLKPLLFELLHEHPSTKVDLYLRSEGRFLKSLSFEGKRTSRALFHNIFELPLNSLVPVRESNDNFKAEGFVCVESHMSRLYVFFRGRRVEITRSQRAEILKIFRNYRVHTGRRGVVNKAVDKGPVIYLNVRSKEQGLETEDISTMFDLIKKSIASVLERVGYVQRNDSPTASQRTRANEIEARDLKDDGGSSLIPQDTLTGVSMTELAERNFTLVKQILSLVILITVKGCLYAIDQHACDERIQLEGLLEEFISNVLDPLCDLSVKFTACATFKVSEEDAEDLLHYSDTFLQYGIRYTVEEKSVCVTHLPLVIVNLKDPKTLKQCLLQHVDDLKDRNKLRIHESDSWFLEVKNIPSLIYESFISQACRLSIKFGDTLVAAEMEYLVVCLARCVLPLQCAHGRPTIVEVDYGVPAGFTEDMDL